jgi:hypothetical protein
VGYRIEYGVLEFSSSLQGVIMTVLRQKIEEELNTLDNRSIAALYEHLQQMNRLRRTARKQRIVAPDIHQVLDLTSTSKSSWSEAVSTNRDERL